MEQAFGITIPGDNYDPNATVEDFYAFIDRDRLNTLSRAREAVDLFEELAPSPEKANKEVAPLRDWLNKKLNLTDKLDDLQQRISPSKLPNTQVNKGKGGE